jgi:hypothetical protein
MLGQIENMKHMTLSHFKKSLIKIWDEMLFEKRLLAVEKEQGERFELLCTCLPVVSAKALIKTI